MGSLAERDSMTRIIYYVAASLDSYIAAPDGGIDWLSAVECPGEDYGYQAFYNTIDELIMGSRTYEQVLGFGDWPYAGKPCRVLSTRELILASPDITVTEQSPSEVVSEFEERDIGTVWLVGGSFVASQFRDRGLISEYIITVVPVILGDGIPLFCRSKRNDTLTLTDTVSFPSGVVQLRYVPAKREGKTEQ